MSGLGVTIVGVDCATDPKKVGLALAHFRAEKPVIESARCASKESGPSSIVAEWLRGVDRGLIALDAPLGWPSALSEALQQHYAGAPLPLTANQMFRRLTDDEICRRLSKRPMDVGADRIARTARSALQFLDELNRTIGPGIELVWSADFRARIGAIEVYPAATRISLGAPCGPGSLKGLARRIDLGRCRAPQSKDARDAIVCALAGAEFLSGRATPPRSDQERAARREGWIWVGDRVKRPSSERTARIKLPSSEHKSSREAGPQDVQAALASPARLWTTQELLQNPCPVDSERGLYGWYFRNLSSVPTSERLDSDDFRLLYIGIAPISDDSDSTMRQRICDNHLRGNASGSTLRLTLGCLLSQDLGIALQQVNGRFHFADGEKKLSAWMQDNARVAWVPHPRPWDVEPTVIRSLDLPLNLDHNSEHPFYGTLKALRRRSREAAKAARPQ